MAGDQGRRKDRSAWLDEPEKQAWTGLVSVMLLLPGALEAPLQREFGLSLFDYMVLSGISEAPDLEMRMSELAFMSNGSLSRLSNTVRRFEQRGWAGRRLDPSDGRYTLVSLTSVGYELVVAAAPVHVAAVREFVLDRLDGTDQAALARCAARMRVLPADVRARPTTP